MSRPIEFRAYHIESKLMLPVDKIVFGKPTLVYSGIKINTLDDVELIQFTGLTDKNGVKIFEGDIITYQEEPLKMKAEVVWKNGGFVFVYKDGIENITSESWYAPMDVEITEVIGNIYQNPELLEIES